MKLSPFIGAVQLAVGQARGITRFGDTPAAFLASLAPLVAFPLVLAGVLMVNGAGLAAVVALLLTLVAQLGPPVLSYDVAKRMGREGQWLRYATAFNWCQWAIPLAAFLILVTLQLGWDDSMDAETASELLVVSLSIYGLWLNWTVARHGLDLTRWRAAVLVLLVNGGTVALVMLPHAIRWALG